MTVRVGSQSHGLPWKRLFLAQNDRGLQLSSSVLGVAGSGARPGAGFPGPLSSYSEKRVKEWPSPTVQLQLGVCSEAANALYTYTPLAEACHVEVQ